MTEQEARTKWCPMAREKLNPLKDMPVNRDNEGYGSSCCIASECMMFRKDPKYSDSYYCGLGGKP